MISTGQLPRTITVPRRRQMIDNRNDIPPLMGTIGKELAIALAMSTHVDQHQFLAGLANRQRQLRCYVIIDLKLNTLSHQDLGQMQMYVNYFDRHVKLADENPTIGLLLCKQKKDAIVELPLPKDSNIHAKEYQLYLPSKELLRSTPRQSKKTKYKDEVWGLNI